ncbi:MAG: hypothetical protein WBX02_03205 [Terriglobales bacterium]
MDRSTLIGMSTGAAVMFGFGIVWLLLGLFRGRPSPKWLRLSLVAVGIVLATSVVILAMRASKLPFDLAPLTAQQLGLNREIARHFYLVFGFELAAIFLAVVVLNLIHYPDYILSGIALIVAVHFFPLAALFKAPVYYGTALVGCAIGLIGFFMADAALRQKVVGISFGLLLWATAAWIAWIGLTITPKIGPNLRPM